jgi:hypothetical protein
MVMVPVLLVKAHRYMLGWKIILVFSKVYGTFFLFFFYYSGDIRCSTSLLSPFKVHSNSLRHSIVVDVAAMMCRTPADQTPRFAASLTSFDCQVLGYLFVQVVSKFPFTFWNIERYETATDVFWKFPLVLLHIINFPVCSTEKILNSLGSQ